MSSIKILLACHKPTELLKNDIFVPIHVGRALFQNNDSWFKENLIGDNTGLNISEKNLNYCELTAHYWAYQNYFQLDNPDYIGFMHYRRHLNFKIEKKYSTTQWGTIHHNRLDSLYIKKFGLDSENIKTVVEQYDILTGNAWDVTNAGSKNNYDHYATSDKKLHIKDYENALKILLEKYPEYKESVKIYNASKYGYYTNIFIMKRDIFHEYAEWLFDILFELEKKTDISKYDFQEARIYGYISEWLFGIWLTYQKSRYKIKELQRTFIDEPELEEEINICMASDDGYAKHMGVAISSVLNHKKHTDKLNFYILDGGISDSNKVKIDTLKKKHSFNIQYIKMDNSLFKDYPLRGSTHFSYATYYRLLLSSLLPNVNKLIYLDCDIIVKSSLRDLYTLNINEKYILGVIDILYQENIARLNLKKYVNAGVLLINLDEWRKNSVEEKFKTYIQNNADKIVWNDQDVLNSVLQDKLEYIDNTWNCQLVESTGGLSFEFAQIKRQAHIIHFVGPKKPWAFNNFDFKPIYYKEVKKSPWRNCYYKYLFEKFLKTIFSVKKPLGSKYKIVTILGIKFKRKRKKFFIN